MSVAMLLAWGWDARADPRGVLSCAPRDDRTRGKPDRGDHRQRRAKAAQPFGLAQERLCA
jgi:hypothetical protein